MNILEYDLWKRWRRDDRSRLTRLADRTAKGSLAVGAIGGATAMYLADPDRGLRRRKIARDRGRAILRKGGRRAWRMSAYALSTMQGTVQHIRHLRDSPEPVADDQMLTDRVLSMAFRGLDIPHGHVNVNSERGVVVLRGALDHPEQIRNLEHAVRKVPGVQEVASYLHLRNTEPPDEIARHFNA